MSYSSYQCSVDVIQYHPLLAVDGKHSMGNLEDTYVMKSLQHIAH